MKKTISFIIMLIICFIYGITVIAGDIPESLLRENQSKVFFAKIISYDKKGKEIEVKVTKKIKGDVEVGNIAKYKTYRSHCCEPYLGDIFLMTYSYGSLDIYRTTTTDTKTLVIQDIYRDGSMSNLTERFEKYLNDGEYEKEERKRLKKMGEVPATIQECFDALDEKLSDERIKEIKLFKTDELVAKTHKDIGLWIRNNWLIGYGDSELAKSLIESGANSPNEMSSRILGSYHKYLNGKYIDDTGKTVSRPVSINYTAIAVAGIGILGILLIGFIYFRKKKIKKV